MKIAVPLFGERISPHFATAPEALLVQTEGGRVCATWRIDLAGLSAAERRAKFLGLGIETLLCGGIDELSRAWFEKKGVHVQENRMGNVRELLEMYVKQTGNTRSSGG